MYASADPDHRDGEAPTGFGALLARQPVAVQLCLCAAAAAFVGWVALQSPMAALAGGAAWAGYVLARPVFRLVKGRAAPSDQEPDSAREAGPGPFGLDPAPAMSFIGPDLVMAGRLVGPEHLEVFGKLSGEVLCGSIRVHPGAVVEAEVIHHRLSVSPGAMFEGRAMPASALPRGRAVAHPSTDLSNPGIFAAE